MVVIPTQDWTINGSVAYTDAKLDDPVPDLGATTGEHLPNVPRFSSTVATDYRFPVFSQKGDVGAAWNYMGSRNAGFEGSADLAYVPLHSYTTVDVHSGVDFGRYNVNLYAKNLLNKWAMVSVDTSDTLYRAAILRPRTIGLMFTASF
jgi:iron complex outermembrane recepter protein